LIKMNTLHSEVSNYIRIGDRTYSYFSGNNYLGLSNHPEIKKAARESIEKYGLNFAAARQTTGTADIHLELEKELSGFKNREDTVVFASGYMGNSILLHALKDRYTSVFIDETAHPSIPDGIPRDIKRIHFYQHCNVQHLEDLLGQHKNSRPLIITDGIFALTGEITPLDEIHTLAEKYRAILVVDDAHATGVLGEQGRGTPEYFGLQNAANIFQTETMSKAIGAYGGFISASEAIITRIRETSRAYLASTALPPPIVSAACSSVRIIRQQPRLRDMLTRNADELRQGVTGLGLHTTGTPTPIIPLYLNTREKARKLSDFLKERGMIVPCIQYPVKTEKFIARITVSANHTMDQIEELLDLLKQWSLKHGVT
jgi:7-keto-8-aminopelargonate synthetase-like enzyme